jgi:hypothetical protein
MRKLTVCCFGLATAATAAFFLTLALPVTAVAQGNCVTLVDNHTFSNGCGRMVTVVWVDQGACRGSGCSDTIGAEAYRTITPITGRACWSVGWGYDYPGRPRC